MYGARFPAPRKPRFASREGENGTPLVLDFTLDGPRARQAMEAALARHRARG